MPKERVRDIAGSFDVVVGWTPDMGVQLATVTADGTPLSKVVESWRSGEDQSGYDEATGVWSTLDRGAINRLIRNLRKARDAAYGADA